MAIEKPLLHAVVMCDYVHMDKSTRKFSLLGTFTGIQISTKFPAIYQPVGVFVMVSHWTSDQSLRFRVVYNLLEVVAESREIKVKKHPPSATVSFGLNLPPLPLPLPGHYAIQVLVDKEILHQFIFDAELVQQQGQQPAEEETP